jgi:hypothetical protein
MKLSKNQKMFVGIGVTVVAGAIIYKYWQNQKASNAMKQSIAAAAAQQNATTSRVGIGDKQDLVLLPIGTRNDLVNFAGFDRAVNTGGYRPIRIR